MVADQAFLGRYEEQQQIRTLIGRARNGRGGALMIAGRTAVVMEAGCERGHLVTDDQLAVSAPGPLGLEDPAPARPCAR